MPVVVLVVPDILRGIFIRVLVAILVVPAILLLTRLALALDLRLTLAFTLLSSILILIPGRILCLGRRTRYQHDTAEQQQSQDCASNIFDAVNFHGSLDRKSTRLNSSHTVISYAV